MKYIEDAMKIKENHIEQRYCKSRNIIIYSISPDIQSQYESFFFMNFLTLKYMKIQILIFNCRLSESCVASRW